MKLPTNLVAVKKISSQVARSSFSVEEIEKAAQLIIEVEGIINPIILKRTSLESYEVVDGDLEYYAALRAREISPLKGEMIQAIILDSDNEKTLLQQIALLRQKSQFPSVKIEEEHNLESHFANLEKIFSSQFEILRQENRRFERSIAQITSKVDNFDIGDELIDKIAAKVVEAIRVSSFSSRSSKKKAEQLKQNPLDLNSATERELATVPGIGQKTASRIVELREKKQGFTNIAELSEIEKVTNNTIEKHQWKECLTISPFTN